MFLEDDRIVLCGPKNGVTVDPQTGEIIGKILYFMFILQFFYSLFRILITIPYLDLLWLSSIIYVFKPDLIYSADF